MNCVSSLRAQGLRAVHAVVAVLAVFLICVESNAAWIDDGVPIVTAEGSQESCRIVSDGAGGSIITWEDGRDFALTGTDIYAQRIDGEGNVLWAVDGVPISTAPNSQVDPQIIADGTGGAIIVFKGYREIYIQKITADGTVLYGANGDSVSTTRVNDYKENARLISDGAGGAIVVWEGSISSGTTHHDLYAQRITAAGVRDWTGGGIPVCLADNSQQTPQLAPDGTGGAIVVWVDARNYYDPTIGGNFQHDIYAQRIEADGGLAWDLAGVPISTAVNSQVLPRIVSDGEFGAIIAWEDQQLSFNFPEIYAQRISNTGDTLWDENGKEISLDATGNAGLRIISDDAGGAILTWESEASHRRIYAQRIDSLGADVWTPALLTVYYEWNHAAHYPQLVRDGSGGAFVTWAAGQLAYANTDIFAQHISALGDTLWGENGVVVCDPVRRQRYPQLIAEGTTGAVVAWDDTRSTSASVYDIYAQSTSGLAISAAGRTVVPDPSDILSLATPNPFNPSTTISFEVAAAGHARLDVYDAAGRLVATLVDGHREAGQHRARWDGRDAAGRTVAAGVYLYRLEVGEIVETERMTLVK